MKHLLAASACACLIVGGAFAQERERTRERTTVTTTTFLTGNTVLAYKVNLGGAAFGKVYDYVITPEGCIEYVVLVDNTNYVFVPWHVVHFDTGARALTIEITRDKLRDVTFTRDTWPKDFRDATFTKKVETVFGQAKKTERSTSEKRDFDRRPGEGDQGKPGDAKKPDKPGSQPPKDKDNPPKDKDKPDKDNPPKDKDKPDKPKKDG